MKFEGLTPHSSVGVQTKLRICLIHQNKSVSMHASYCQGIVKDSKNIVKDKRSDLSKIKHQKQNAKIILFKKFERISK